MPNERQRTFDSLARLGISYADSCELVRASATLHTWNEHECNGVIQRDEKTGRPYWYSDVTGKRIGPTSDRERGAVDRVKKIAERYQLAAYFQGDPRGCALYLYKPIDLDTFARRAGVKLGETSGYIESCYNSIGIAVVP